MPTEPTPPVRPGRYPEPHSMEDLTSGYFTSGQWNRETQPIPNNMTKEEWRLKLAQDVKESG